MELDYDDLRLNLSDYLDHYYFEFRNGSHERHNYAEQPMKIFSPSFAGFRKKNFHNCYALQTPHDNQRTTLSEHRTIDNGERTLGNT